MINKEGTGRRKPWMVNKNEVRDFLCRLFLISAGFALAGLGTALMYKAELGSSPNATMADGLHVLFHVSYGTGNILANLITLAVVLVFARDLIRYGTLVCVFTMGIYVNFWDSLIPALLEGAGWVLRLLTALLGNVIMSAGLAFYVKIHAGLGSLEAIAEFLRRTWNCRYSLAKTAEDAVLLVAGICLGGTFGAGTVISVFMTGILMQWFFRFYEKTFGFLKRFE